MRLLRSGYRRNSGSDQLFDKNPAISWNKKTQEITLSVSGVPHQYPSNPSRFNYRVSLSIEELQKMIVSLAAQNPN